MSQVFLVTFWILATLGISSFAGYLGKRFSVSFPIGIMGSLVVIAAILANKIVVVGGLAMPAGVIVASSTFLITDILSEKWGRKAAQQAVWVGLYGMLLLITGLWIAIAWEPAPFARDHAESFASVLGMTPRIIAASVIAYMVSQHHDVWAFHFWKDRFQGKHLWLRNNASTIVSQLIDTVIFITIAFYGTFPIFTMIRDMWMVKTAVALLDTPFIYAVSWLIDCVDQPSSSSEETLATA